MSNCTQNTRRVTIKAQLTGALTMITVQVTRKGITDKDGNAIAVGTELTHNGSQVPAPWVNKVRIVKGTKGKSLEVATPEPAKTETSPAEPEAANEDVDSLKDEYQELFGKSPHHLMKPETIRQKIDEELAKTE
jgi:hypothetical protein